jgi:hypothetical protein
VLTRVKIFDIGCIFLFHNEVYIVNYFSFSFLKKIWFSACAYLRPASPDVLKYLSDRSVYLVENRDNYPRILPLLDNVDQDGFVELDNRDRQMLARIMPRYSLEPRAVLKVCDSDYLIPLVLIFKDVFQGRKILLTILYGRSLSNIIGVCYYNPGYNLLTFKYFHGNRELIRIGVSQINEIGKEEWFYDNYVYRDSIIHLPKLTERKGQIWFTKPFVKK